MRDDAQKEIPVAPHAVGGTFTGEPPWPEDEVEVLRHLVSDFEVEPKEARDCYSFHPGVAPHHTRLLHDYSFALRLSGRLVIFTYIGEQHEEDSWIVERGRVLYDALEFALREIVGPAAERFAPGGGLDLKLTDLSMSRSAGDYVELAGRLEAEADGGPARTVGIFGYDSPESLRSRFVLWVDSAAA
jgi:hypothetical protein